MVSSKYIGLDDLVGANILNFFIGGGGRQENEQFWDYEDWGYAKILNIFGDMRDIVWG